MPCTCDPAISLATRQSSDRLRHHRSPVTGLSLSLSFYTALSLFLQSMIHPIFSSLLSFDPLSVCLSHISHFDLVSILVTSHTLPPSPHTQPLHPSGSVSAHLHVTTCIEFWFSTGRASRVVSLRLFPLLATYINIYLISLLVLRAVLSSLIFFMGRCYAGAFLHHEVVDRLTCLF
jgi:hypothetical protein